MAGQKILVVEDNAVNRRLVEVILRGRGYVVVEATTGSEALAFAKADPPDLILMDLGLPGLDGLSITQQLKADPDTAGIPVIALTASAMRGDRERALAAGCDGYIAKPISKDELVKTVAGFLPPLAC